MRMLVIPVLGNGLGSGVEPDGVGAEHVLVTEERFLVAREREISGRNRNANIDADHAAVGE